MRVLICLASVSGFVPSRTDGGCRMLHPHPAAKSELGDWTQCVGEGGVATVHASNGEGVVFADDIVRALPAVRGQVAVG